MKYFNVIKNIFFNLSAHESKLFLSLEILQNVYLLIVCPRQSNGCATLLVLRENQSESESVYRYRYRSTTVNVWQLITHYCLLLHKD